MIIMRARAFKRDNPETRDLDSKSTAEEVAAFKEALARHFVGPDGLVLLEFCDDATGMLVADILNRGLGIEMSPYNLVMRVDKQIPRNEAPLKGVMYLFTSLLSLARAPEHQSMYEYILERWRSGEIRIRWVET